MVEEIGVRGKGKGKRDTSFLSIPSCFPLPLFKSLGQVKLTLVFNSGVSLYETASLIPSCFSRAGGC